LKSLAGRPHVHSLERPTLWPSTKLCTHPTLVSELMLLTFWPGILAWGSSTYLAATAQTRPPVLVRWLLLTAVVFSASAPGYAMRVALAHSRVLDVDNQGAEATDRSAATQTPRSLSQSD